MKVIKSIIRDPEALKERFLPNMIHGGLFLPDVLDLTVGERLCLWLNLRSHSAELHLYGTVYWLRYRAGNISQNLGAGAGVGFRAGQEDQIAFLESVLRGNAEPFPRRRSPRTPLLSPWRCQLESGEPPERRPAMLTDIARGGTLAVAGALRVEPGDILNVILPWHSETPHTMKVAWTRRTDTRCRIGLSRQRSGQSADRAWAELVGQARSQFSANLSARTSNAG